MYTEKDKNFIELQKRYMGENYDKTSLWGNIVWDNKTGKSIEKDTFENFRKLDVFASRESYIEFVRQWKEDYAYLSFVIRSNKAEIKTLQRTNEEVPYGAIEITRGLMKVRATLLLEL